MNCAACAIISRNSSCILSIYSTCQKIVLKTVHSICVARRQRFPKNGVKQSVPFRSTVRFVPFYVPLHGRFHFIHDLDYTLPRVVQVRTVAVAFDGLPLPDFLATDPDSINLAKNLAIPRPVAFIPSCFNFQV